ncbi:hypothetical protein CFF98v445_04950 [Campylobacter fetus subsp. fetus]|uniref:Uncharacterized protein n=2 Tax=Campylobacter fetus TaxID=196 RepID=A0AAE6IYJ5_CAMFE|nr:hypothetical protein [Campylobacter fetus]ABK82881.1 hypothetical protein CFF8240_0876 [Campylobacter fetus subsp. fetus 82-40]OCS15715.1 hypothetical protein CFF98v445_04950 [Campylobacter fetus subsp. fetus]OCS18986.1 hypothetical protein CFFBT1098_02270 [Campylobacter fetus subsp. fetus BT 10/98]OCS19642.1 hypothetical protein CFVI03596_09190 [Campylobacter fetus subsp. venerealis cfvi03/596]OCS23330.1 hypothetical protein CFVI97532_00710 [Campylobacter fetus subsp. venerealis cfvi97/532
MLAYKAISKALENKKDFKFILNLEFTFISVFSYLAFIVTFPIHCNCIFKRKTRLTLLHKHFFLYLDDDKLFYKLHGLKPPLVLFEMRKFY